MLLYFKVNTFQCVRNRVNETPYQNSTSSSPDSSTKSASNKQSGSTSSTELQDMEKGDSDVPSDFPSSYTAFMAPPSYTNDEAFDNDENQENETSGNPSTVAKQQKQNFSNNRDMAEKDSDVNDEDEEDSSTNSRQDSTSSFTSNAFVLPQTGYTNDTFEEESVNDEGILSTSGIYVGDNSFQQVDDILTVDHALGIPYSDW